MKLTMLGTGNALVFDYYNTCFVLSEEGRHFLVDAGGGNQVLTRLRDAGIDWKEIKDIFVTHKHVDHILGVIWMIRMVTQNMAAGKYEGEVNIYAHDEVIGLLKTMSEGLLQKKQTKFIGERLHFITVEDGESREIIGRRVTFFDIGSTKAKQFGFAMELADGKKLTCCGDEPYSPCEEKYALGCDWLLHEAFCLYDQAEIFKPYEKHHSTVKDAAELAAQLGVKNLLLYHSEEKTAPNRRTLYTAEAEKYFDGNIFVPEDMESLEL